MDDTQTACGAIENLPDEMKPRPLVGPFDNSGARFSAGSFTPLKDESGNRYFRLTVIARAGIKRREATFLCRCDCGAETIASGRALRLGRKRSCGCGWRLAALRRERAA